CGATSASTRAAWASASGRHSAAVRIFTSPRLVGAHAGADTAGMDSGADRGVDTSTDLGRAVALDRAHALAVEWLDSLGDRPVPPRLTTDEVTALLDPVLPDGPTDASAVVDELAAACEPGLTAMPG